MGRRPLTLAATSVSSLLDAVMEKRISAALVEDEAGAHCFPESRVNLLLSSSGYLAQRDDLATVAQARQLLQNFLGDFGQPLQLSDHERHDVVSEPLGADPLYVPTPGERLRIEPDQSFLCQCGEKLDGKKRIAGSFLMHQISQLLNSLLFAAKRVCNQAADVVAAQGRQHNLCDPRPGQAS